MLIAILSGGLSGCNTVEEASASKEQRFWAWFAEHEGELYEFEADRDAIFDRLHAEMLKVYSSAAFQFGPVLADGRREFILSADGNIGDFPAVDALYNAAPKLPRWIIVKFIPRRSDDPLTMTTIGGKAFQTDQLRYHLDPAGHQVDLRVYVPGLTTYEKDAVRYWVFVTLQAQLGEEDFGIRVRRYTVLPETDKGFVSSSRIVGLAAAFDAYFENQTKSYH